MPCFYGFDDKTWINKSAQDPKEVGHSDLDYKNDLLLLKNSPKKENEKLQNMIKNKYNPVPCNHNVIYQSFWVRQLGKGSWFPSSILSMNLQTPHYTELY